MPSETTKDTNTTSNQSGTSTSQSSYAPQVADLNTAFTDAMKAYATAGGAKAPTDFTAQFSPDQLQAFRNMIGYGGDTALPTSQANNGTTLSNAGVGGVTGALSGFAGFDPSASNNPDALIAAATKYAGGQDIPAMVKAAMQGATETARDVTLPGISQGAALSGNTNSSRTGISEGLVKRGLAETSENLEGSLRSQAFQNGLTLAQQQASGNNASKLASVAGQGALGTSAASAGNIAENSSVANMIQKLSAAASGGAGLTAADQANLDNMMKQYQSGVNSSFAPLANLLSIIGGNYGQTTNFNTNGTSTEHSEGTQTASPLSIGAGILGAGTSLLGSGGLNLLAPAGAGILSWLKG
jgi:hypothetical protein